MTHDPNDEMLRATRESQGQPMDAEPRPMTTGREPKLTEPVLPDDYPVYGNYLYVADGEVIMSDWHDITVRRLKHELGAKEIRRCDIAGRAALSLAGETP